MTRKELATLLDIPDYKVNEMYWDSVKVDRLLELFSLERKPVSDQEDEPYFGWCDVDGCDNEGCSGGMAWRESGYWTVCSKHAQMHREGKDQPKMKQKAIDKEKTRKPDGTLRW